jgi:hypothetical protein
LPASGAAFSAAILPAEAQGTSLPLGYVLTPDLSTITTKDAAAEELLLVSSSLTGTCTRAPWFPLCTGLLADGCMATVCLAYLYEHPY